MNFNPICLENKFAMVTGGHKGLGLAIAKVLGQAGARLFLVARDAGGLKQTTKEFMTEGIDCAYAALDLSQAEAPAQAVQQMVAHYGRIDILVNNAGTTVVERAENLDLKDWDRVFNLNVRALFLASQAAGRVMLEQGGGNIVNISSQAGTIAMPGRTAYCGSKGAVDQITRNLALDWAKNNIRVNAVAPTFIETPMTAERLKQPEFKNWIEGNIPMGSMPAPQDIAYAVLFLASDWARYITGHILAVDGGWTIQ